MPQLLVLSSIKTLNKNIITNNISRVCALDLVCKSQSVSPVLSKRYAPIFVIPQKDVIVDCKPRSRNFRENSHHAVELHVYKLVKLKLVLLVEQTQVK